MSYKVYDMETVLWLGKTALTGHIEHPDGRKTLCGKKYRDSYRNVEASGDGEVHCKRCIKIHQSIKRDQFA